MDSHICSWTFLILLNRCFWARVILNPLYSNANFSLQELAAGRTTSIRKHIADLLTLGNLFNKPLTTDLTDRFHLSFENNLFFVSDYLVMTCMIWYNNSEKLDAAAVLSLFVKQLCSACPVHSDTQQMCEREKHAVADFDLELHTISQSCSSELTHFWNRILCVKVSRELRRKGYGKKRSSGISQCLLCSTRTLNVLE